MLFSLHCFQVRPVVLMLVKKHVLMWISSSQKTCFDVVSSLVVYGMGKCGERLMGI